jgi:hypothetical protein
LLEYLEDTELGLSEEINTSNIKIDYKGSIKLDIETEEKKSVRSLEKAMQ